MVDNNNNDKKKTDEETNKTVEKLNFCFIEKSLNA